MHGGTAVRTNEHGRNKVLGDNGQTVRGNLPGWCRRASRMLGFGSVFASGILRSEVDVISILFHRPVALSHIEVPPNTPIPRCSPHLGAFNEGGSQKVHWMRLEDYLYSKSCSRGTK
jgi:hypothetical protein